MNSHCINCLFYEKEAGVGLATLVYVNDGRAVQRCKFCMYIRK